ncbi:MAG: adenylyl-sulfate kinase [Enterobacteriaceae bacterium]
MSEQEGATNLRWHQHLIARQQREQLLGQRGAIVWLTGLSGAGKSTIASAAEHLLHQQGVHTYLLDGDNIRHGLCRDLSFSDDDRRQNIRRVGEVAALFLDAGLVVLTAFISPHSEEREQIRERVPPGRFFEVYIDTPLSVCEQRDPKQLYQRARQGEITQFTGIDSGYQPPLQPELRLNGEQTLADSAGQIVQLLRSNEIIR